MTLGRVWCTICIVMMRKERDMTEVTAKEMIALIDEDIKFALMAGDKEFVGYLKEEKAKILDAEYPTRHEEYNELFYEEVKQYLRGEK